MVKPGDRMTDWAKGQTFTVARVGKHQGATLLLDVAGGLYRLEDCKEPDSRYHQPLTRAELDTLAVATMEELCGDTRHLLAWLGLLSDAQKRQLWARFSPDTREDIALVKYRHQSLGVAA